MSVQTSNHRWRFITVSKDITVFLVLGTYINNFCLETQKKKRLQLLRAVIQRRYYKKIVK